MFKEPFSFIVAFIQRKKQKQKKKRIESWSKWGKGQNVENQNVESLKENIESLKVDQKFKKDQNVENHFVKKIVKSRLSTFWSFLTP